MPSATTIESTGPRATTGRELRAIAVIALPLAGAYLAELGMHLVTKVVAGRLGPLELAAVGLAGDLAFELLIVLMGMLSIVGVVASEADGAGKPEAVRHRACQGAVIAVGLAVPGTLAVWHLDRLLPWLGQDPRVVELTGPFFAAMAPSVLAILLFTVLRNVLAALHRTRGVLVVTVGAVVLEAVLAYGWVLGRLGMPRLGVAGAGLAISVATWGMLLGLVALTARDRTLRRYALFTTRPSIDVPLCAGLFRLGLPVAGIVTLESGLFAAVALLVGLFGAEALAANQVAIGWAATAFVIVLGLSEAVMVRVARWSGIGDLASARRAGLLGIALAVGIMAGLAAVPLTFPGAIVGVFLDTADPSTVNVGSTAVALLLIAALFGVFDGLQAVASRALRALRDTLVPMWIAAFGYWGIGVGGGALLAFPLGFGPEGVWWGLAAGLMVTGVALAWRFRRLTEPGRKII